MITTLTGPNTYKIDQIRREMIDKFVLEFSDLAVEHINCDEVEYQAIHDNLLNLPFLTPKKLVILMSPSANKMFAERFSAIVEEIPTNIEVLIIEDDIDKRSTFYKQLKKLTTFIECLDLNTRELTEWVLQKVRAEKGSISSADASYLVEKAGVNQLRLNNEINKLLSYDPNISELSIELLVEPSPQTTIFQLLDAVFAGRAKDLLRIYEDQKLQKVQPQQVIAMLAWQVHILALVKTAGNMSASQIASRAKLNPFVVSKSIGIVRNLELSDIISLSSKLLDLDIKLKTKTIDADDALLQLLLSIKP